MPLMAQEGSASEAGKPKPMTVHDRLRECMGSMDEHARLKTNLEALIRQLAPQHERHERETLESLTQWILPASDGKSADLDDKRRADLRKRLAMHRRQGRVEIMLPALHIAERDERDHPFLLLALAEAYGTDSPFFDAKDSLANFRRLQGLLEGASESSLRSDAKWGQLRQAVPEVRVLGLERKDPWVPFMQFLRDCIEQLDAEEPQPLPRWALRSLAMEGLTVRLKAVLRDPSHEKLEPILREMVETHPKDPGTHLVLGQMYASAGRRPRPEPAQEHLRAFLLCTDPDWLESPQAAQLGIHKAGVEERLEDLGYPRVRQGLESIREEAIRLGDRMRDKPSKLQLVLPDIEDIKHWIKEREKQLKAIAEAEEVVRDKQRDFDQADAALVQYLRTRSSNKEFSDPDALKNKKDIAGRNLRTAQKYLETERNRHPHVPTLKELQDAVARQRLEPLPWRLE